jgi:hypothetical protein
MNIPSSTRILTEALPAEVRKWIAFVIEPINSFMLTIKNGLNKGITINENMAGAIKTVRVSGGAVSFAYTSSSRPQAVLIGNLEDLTTAGDHPGTAIGLKWNYDGSVINCTFYGLEASHNYNITLVIFDN